MSLLPLSLLVILISLITLVGLKRKRLSRNRLLVVFTCKAVQLPCYLFSFLAEIFPDFSILGNLKQKNILDHQTANIIQLVVVALR